MLSVKPFTNDIINDIVNKPFYFLDGDQLNICNTIQPDDWAFLRSIMVIIILKLYIMSMTDQYAQNAEIQ